jgi:hypothetical protein
MALINKKNSYHYNIDREIRYKKRLSKFEDVLKFENTPSLFNVLIRIDCIFWYDLYPKVLRAVADSELEAEV